MVMLKRRSASDMRRGNVSKQNNVDQPQEPVSTGTLLDRSLRVNGNISGNDAVALMGNFEGICDLRGGLEIGASAMVQGDIKAATISISGQVNGDVEATERLQLTSTARIKGHIHTTKLSVSEGAVFDGELQMTGKSKSGNRVKKEDNS